MSHPKTHLNNAGQALCGEFNAAWKTNEPEMVTCGRCFRVMESIAKGHRPMVKVEGQP